jgi:hypothetical protein
VSISEPAQTDASGHHFLALLRSNEVVHSVETMTCA